MEQKLKETENESVERIDKMIEAVYRLNKAWMNTLKDEVNSMIEAAYPSPEDIETKKKIENLLWKDLGNVLSNTVNELFNLREKVVNGKIDQREADKQLRKIYSSMCSKIYGIFTDVGLISVDHAEELRSELNNPLVSLQYPLFGGVVFGAGGLMMRGVSKKAASVAAKKTAEKVGPKIGRFAAKTVSFMARAAAYVSWGLAVGYVIYGDVQLAKRTHDVKQQLEVRDRILEEFEETWKETFGTEFGGLKDIVPKKK